MCPLLLFQSIQTLANEIGAYARSSIILLPQKIIRKITEVTEYIPTKHGYDTRYLFHYDTNGQPIYHSISISLFDALKKHHLHFDMIEPFIPKERENEKK